MIWSQEHNWYMILFVPSHVLLTLVISCIIQEKYSVLSPRLVLQMKSFNQLHDEQKECVRVGSATVDSKEEVTFIADCCNEVDTWYS